MRKLKWLYKYGCPALLFIISILSLLAYNRLYHISYQVIDQLFGYSIFVCLFWLFDGHLRRKCIYYFASVYGLAFNCIMTLLIKSDLIEYNTYIELFKLTGITIATLIVLAYIIIEEYGPNLFRSKHSEY